MVTLIQYLGFALTLVWVSNVVPRPPTKRAAAIGIVNGFGNLGNLYVISFYSRFCNDVENLMSILLSSIGSYAWKAAWGPEYHQSMEIGIAALAFSSFLALSKFRFLFLLLTCLSPSFQLFVLCW